MPRLLLILALLVGVTAGQAYADPLDITSIMGDWVSPVGGASVAIGNVGGQGTDMIRWGDGSAPDSGYNFTPGGDITGVPLDTVFVLGDFTHLNEPIPIGSGITSVNYDLSFSTNGTPSSLMTSLMFSHNETRNASNPCDGGTGANWVGDNSMGCADIVTVTSASLNSPIDVGGEIYFFNLLGFSSDGGTSFQTQFVSPEKGNNTARLYGIVGLPQQVPEPSTLFLLGTGLAVVSIKRRRRTK